MRKATFLKGKIRCIATTPRIEVHVQFEERSTKKHRLTHFFYLRKNYKEKMVTQKGVKRKSHIKKIQKKFTFLEGNVTTHHRLTTFSTFR